MLQLNQNRWTFFHLLCRCPLDKSVADCPLNKRRKETVLDNYFFATKEASENEIDQVLEYHCRCFKERRNERLFKKKHSV
ncbi:hypothetical protein [uncultured Draconibacterium sp.]|uniref:hypothetical protein n=1 Tax=uncultured Draconibacterium sp. TaxID=1573823 RepID=UPI003260D7A4